MAANMQTQEDRQSEPAVNNGDQDGIWAGYNGGEEMPLASFAVLMGLYGATVGGFLLAQKMAGRELPEKVGTRDLFLLGVATHKVSRLITRDWVTAPIRAPFTTYEGSTGAGEVKEKARGQGMQRALGSLFTCPWCTGAWTAAAFGCGFALSPRLTRFIASIFTVETVSDCLHLGYEAAKKGVKE